MHVHVRFLSLPVLIFDDNRYEKKIKLLNNKEFEELTLNLSSGIPIATPGKCNHIVLITQLLLKARATLRALMVTV